MSTIYSKRTISFVDDEIIKIYSQWSDIDDQYNVDIRDICETELYKLCAYMIQDCPDYLVDITQTDNRHFEKYIQPSLLSNLRYSLDAEQIKENAENINKGIYLILSEKIEELIEERLPIYNIDMSDYQDYEGDRAWM